MHVLPEELFAAQRIHGSVNACVYEVAFLARVAELAPSKLMHIVVYGAGEGSVDSAAAESKLRAAGYANVASLETGKAGWTAAGFPLEGTGQLPLAMRLDGTFAIDTPSSVIRWTGRNLFNYHRGTLKLRHGEIVFSSGKAASAHFDIEMNTLACEDIADKAMNAMLIRHLCDTDFFDVAHFPIATFAGTRIQPLETSTEGSDNYLVEGELTVRGITRPISSTAVVALDGDRVTAQSTMVFDRTAFGSHYGSGKFFRFLGKHVVNDHVQLHLILHADRKGP